MDGLDTVLTELKVQGRNHNQLTVLANMGRVTIVRGDELAGSYAYLCDEIYRLAQEVQ